MSYKVDMGENPPLSLNEKNEILSILQNIRVILGTAKGSVPLYREFGLDQRFLDMPEPVARSMMIGKIRDAIEQFEPRARFAGVSFKPAQEGRIIPVVEVEIVGGE